MARLKSKVAVIRSNGDVRGSFERALSLIGGIDDLNTEERTVIVKPGIFDHRKQNHPTVSAVSAIISCFSRAPRIFMVESDNYRGTGLERLQVYKDLFNERVSPFNLSDDTNTREVTIAGEEMSLSHVLFKPNVFVSTHVLRRFDKGTILKNLLGLTPDRKKARFHKRLVTLLLDIYEAIGGIDLAVIDGTRSYRGPGSDKGSKTELLLVGRDAVAVEALGSTLCGLKPEKVPVIQGAVKRELGEGDITNIEVLGEPIERLRQRRK